MSIRHATAEQLKAAQAKFDAVIIMAAGMYSIPDLADRVNLTFYSHGKRAGYAKRLLNGNFLVAINAEALAVDYNDTIEDTIPHEIAHIVMFITKKGKNHDAVWKRCCIALGGTGKRCHDLDLTPAKRHAKYEYELIDGTLRTVGAKVHKKIQNGNRNYHFKNRGGPKLFLFAENFVRVVY
jgi:predicted SprT family Zn-dependent metalloprotease